ncbi:hypothetical protein IFM89_036781 [Coptis chinensis]|uniref:Uncharacterized protein n=1 Tax=Coptis chinensis TaxID=261450 RepID=A0A835HUJ2_9MAGN|nr:hypothetical protein IFM89_036781 [Coptis chinensis]
MGIHIANSNNEWLHTLRTCSSNSFKSEVKRVYIYICATISAIWQKRNSRIFKGKNIPHQLVMVRILDDTKNYMLIMAKEVPDCISLRVLLHRLGIDANFKIKTSITCQWLKPELGIVKVNIDGSVSAHNNGFGGNARDSEGKVIFAYSGYDKSMSIRVQ